jgi:recombinational DNA repair ATPase RecF
MIQVEEIRIEEFRGIRHLELHPKGKSFVVWGPNGSGKSGVVDAIDFGLTGNITRLTGMGTGNVSLHSHGAHVLMRDNIEAAKVSLTITDPVSGKRGVLTRSVKTAATYTLEPDMPVLRAAIEEASQHPELTLSRREIIKYILAKPSDRAQSIQALLKLDRLDQARKVVRTALTQAEKDASGADRNRASAEAEAARHLGVVNLSSAADMAREINRCRALLGLSLIDRLTPDADLKEGVEPSNGSALNKESAIRDVRALADGIARPNQIREAAGKLASALNDLAADPAITSMIRHRALVESGLAAVTEAQCPLCDMSWPDLEGLRAHLQEKLARSDSAAALEKRIRSSATTIQAGIRSLTGTVQTVHALAAKYGDPELPHHLMAWSDDLTRLSGQIGTTDGAAGALGRVSTDILAVPAVVVSGLANLQAALEALPDESAKHQARSFLEFAQDRWTGVRVARAAAERARRTHKIAQSVYDSYCAAVDEELRNLYSAVETDFSSYYRQINSDNESEFKALLEPSAGTLDFQVDFHGNGLFPPAAYHSEGHQDGMGICLYLALARQIFGDNFRFAVMDDVVMSVDSSHRRHFCRLLKEEFPDVQFIITTHDEVWARQMLWDGLITSKSQQARFHDWTVAEGPILALGEDVWDRIDADLADDDVPSAAQKLRRYLEGKLGDICAALRGSVTYKPDASYDLGNFSTAVNTRHKELLTDAMKSAVSWKNQDAEQRVKDLKTQRSEALKRYGQEDWAINKLVHYNEWATLVPGDFIPVVQAARQFLDLFKCGNLDCKSGIRVVGSPMNEESLRCDCGEYSLNLKAG